MLHKSHYFLFLAVCFSLSASQVVIDTTESVKALYGEIAKSHPSLEEIDKLLDNGVSVDAPCEEWTPLLYAIRKGHHGVCERLVARGADLNRIQNSSGATPLICALCLVSDNRAKGKNELAERQGKIAQFFLQQREIRTDQADNQRGTALHYAALAGMRDICEQLIESGKVNILSKGLGENNAFHLALQGAHFELARYLMRKNVPIQVRNEKGETALHIAAKRDNPDFVKVLKEKGALLDATTSEGQTPLHYAAERGCLKSGKALLELGASCDIVDSKGQTPFDKAIFSFQPDFCFLLLEYMSSFPAFKEKSMTALHRAAQYESKKLCKAMLLKIIKVDLVNEKGETPLMLAARRTDDAIISLFIEKGASVSHKSIDGSTALHYAALCSSVPVCEKLLEKDKALLDIRNSSNDSPLFSALSHGAREVAVYLMEQEADVHTQNVLGKTPLHLAAESGCIDAIY